MTDKLMPATMTPEMWRVAREIVMSDNFRWSHRDVLIQELYTAVRNVAPTIERPKPSGWGCG